LGLETAQTPLSLKWGAQELACSSLIDTPAHKCDLPLTMAYVQVRRSSAGSSTASGPKRAGSLSTDGAPLALALRSDSAGPGLGRAGSVPGHEATGEGVGAGAGAGAGAGGGAGEGGVLVELRKAESERFGAPGLGGRGEGDSDAQDPHRAHWCRGEGAIATQGGGLLPSLRCPAAPRRGCSLRPACTRLWVTTTSTTSSSTSKNTTTHTANNSTPTTSNTTTVTRASSRGRMWGRRRGEVSSQSSGGGPTLSQGERRLQRKLSEDGEAILVQAPTSGPEEPGGVGAVGEGDGGVPGGVQVGAAGAAVVAGAAGAAGVVGVVGLAGVGAARVSEEELRRVGTTRKAEREREKREQEERRRAKREEKAELRRKEKEELESKRKEKLEKAAQVKREKREQEERRLKRHQQLRIQNIDISQVGHTPPTRPIPTPYPTHRCPSESLILCPGILTTWRRRRASLSL